MIDFRKKKCKNDHLLMEWGEAQKQACDITYDMCYNETEESGIG